MEKYRVNACTDITGFGLLGHLVEMVGNNECGLELEARRIPAMPEAREYAAMGLVPAGAYKNRDFYESAVNMSSSIDRSFADVLYDPQTSGGLLICVGPEDADKLLKDLKAQGVDQAAIIGEVVFEPKGKIVIK